MPYVQLEPKYTYTVGHDWIKWPSQPAYPSTLSENIWTSNHYTNSWTDALCAFFAPGSTLPTLGTGHNQRIGNKITVQSVRYRIYVNLAPALACPNDGNPFSESEDNQPSQISRESSVVTNPRRWFKMRLYIVQFDNTLNVNPLLVASWFYNTYLPYQDTVSGDTQSAFGAPVSTHSKLLRMSSPYSGQFNILLDKCFTLYSNKPQVLLDYTVPLNFTYVWRDDGTLQTPKNIMCFILPPLNWNIDVDPFTSYQYRYAYDHNLFSQTDKWFNFSYFSKVNFTDL